MVIERTGERTTASSGRFHYSFRLGGDPRELPPGNYTIHVREDVYQGVGDPMSVAAAVDFVVEMRGATTTRIVKPEDLRAALARDASRRDQGGDER